MALSSLLRPGEARVKRLAVALGRAVVRTGKNSPIDPAQVHSILVIRQHNQLGDMLCVVPLLRALRTRFPGCRLSLMTSPVNHEVMLHHRLLDDVIKYDKREFLSGKRVRIRALRGFIGSLRRFKFDLAVVPSTVSMSFTSDILAYFSGARWRIGPEALEGKENPGAFLYTHPVRLSWAAEPGRHQTLRNMDICHDLSLNAPDLALELTLLPEERTVGSTEVDSVKMGARRVVAFHPGAGKVPNQWPAAYFARVIEALHREDGCGIIVVKGPMDDDPVNDLRKNLAIQVYFVENQPIRRVASILASVDLLVSNDTGIMHVGAAVGTPVLSLFGPTDPRQWAPRGQGNCYIRGESGSIENITVGAVVEAARRMLREHELTRERQV